MPNYAQQGPYKTNNVRSAPRLRNKYTILVYIAKHPSYAPASTEGILIAEVGWDCVHRRPPDYTRWVWEWREWGVVLESAILGLMLVQGGLSSAPERPVGIGADGHVIWAVAHCGGRPPGVDWLGGGTVGPSPPTDDHRVAALWHGRRVADSWREMAVGHWPWIWLGVIKGWGLGSWGQIGYCWPDIGGRTICGGEILWWGG